MPTLTGYHSRMTGHGLCGLASTILNENGFNGDWIERQLPHAAQNGVPAAYNGAQYLSERRRMMGWWEIIWSVKVAIQRQSREDERA